MLFHGGGTSSGGGGSGLSATIVFPGGSPVSSATFTQSGATNMGNYVAPTAGFTQQCFRARNASIPNFFVDFRPDTVGGHVDVVFWNGEVDPAGLTVASGHARDLPSYTVTITNNGSTIYSATIPYHYWATRWRYKSADRAIIRTASQVFSDGFFPHMTLTAARLSGNNLSTGQSWSGLPYSNAAGQIIQPSLSRSGARSFSTTYTPFMPPDTVNPGNNAMPATTLASGASSGASSISVASSSGFSTTDHVSIQLSDGTYFTTRVLTIVGTTWTLEFTLPNSANNGAAVYNGEYKLGLILYMETGGERAELGAMTEWAADYLLNGTANSLNAIRQHAEMSCSEWPFFLPDLGTGAALNFKSDLTHYKVFIGPSDYGGYYRAAFTNQSNGWDFHENDSHFQFHPFIAYALTEDAYFLEGTQYLQAYGFGTDGTMLGREGNPTTSHGQYGWGDLLGTPNGTGGTNGSFTMCSYYGEIRTVGNGTRNLAMAYKIAPVSPPSWLLPQSYYASVSSDYSSVINTLFTTSSEHLHSVFFQLGEDNFYQAFEQSYGIFGMSLADLYSMPTGGNPSWLTQLTFYFQMIDALTNGTSGWNNQTPQVHDLQNNTTSGGCVSPYSSGCNVTFSSYASFTALYAAVSGFLKNGATFPSAAAPGNQQGGSMGNCNMMLAAAAFAKSRGVTAATNAFSYMNNFIDYNYPNNADASMGISMEMKCGFDGT